MIALSMVAGNRLTAMEWLGVGTAFGGFVVLVLPGVSAPSVHGFVLMSVAGTAWGIYTLLGRGSKNPLADTAYNFLRTVPAAFAVVGNHPAPGPLLESGSGPGCIIGDRRLRYRIRYLGTPPCAV